MSRSSSPKSPPRRAARSGPGVGAELILEIHDLARGGAGVTRGPEGVIVFVPWTMPGDRVRVRIREQKRRYANADLLEVLEPSPDRVEPRCPAFGVCGGCQWQHVPYLPPRPGAPSQWTTKLRGLREALSRVTVELDVPLDEFPATQVFGYRNRVQLRGRGRELGFLTPGEGALVPVDGCPLARPEINARWEEIRDLGERVGGAYKVEVEVLEAGRVRFVWDAPHGAAGFRQVHDEQNRSLQDWVARRMEGGDELLDLFGGRGNLSLGLAERFAHVHCVDTAAPARGLPEAPPNLHFHRQVVTTWLRGHRPAGARVAAILDPPRQGLGRGGEAVAMTLRDLGVGPVVLVGCDADAWARDLGAFLRKGWELVRTGAVDLFPQTHHVEALAYLER